VSTVQDFLDEQAPRVALKKAADLERQLRITASKYVFMHAEFDEDEAFRYSLERWFGTSGKSSALFVGLNPSTATASIDDPTIRREVGYTRDWGYTRYLKANLYAFRSTNPKALYANPCPARAPSLPGYEKVGRRNMAAIQALMDRADVIVACWGANKLHPAAIAIAELILADPRTRCLGLTKDGAPRHPLYLPKNAALVPIAPAKGYVAL
jgi:hypothetical protein